MRTAIAQKPNGAQRFDVAGTNITTAAWVTIIAAMAKAACAVEIFNSSGKVLQLAMGSAGNEVAIPYYVLPGGSSILLPLEIKAGARLSAKAIDANATTGQILLNFFG